MSGREDNRSEVEGSRGDRREREGSGGLTGGKTIRTDRIRNVQERSNRKKGRGSCFIC